MGNFRKQKLTLLGTIFLAACGGGGGGGGGGGTSDGGGYGTTPSNTAPTIDNSTNDYSTIEGTTNGFMVNASDADGNSLTYSCLLYTSPSPRDRTRSRMPSSA